MEKVKCSCVGCSKFFYGPRAQGGDARQRPIDMVSEYKCIALGVDMDATVGDRASVDALVAASNVNDGAREEDAWAATDDQPRGTAAKSGSQGDEAEDDNASETRSERGGAAGCGDGVMAYFGDHQARMHAHFSFFNACQIAGAPKQEGSVNSASTFLSQERQTLAWHA